MPTAERRGNVMRAGARYAACTILLAGATVLAFFSGGYFDSARSWAGLVVWALVAVAVIVEPRSVPRAPASWLALGGLALFGGWTLASMLWAPLAGSAYHAGQIVLLYLGGLLAAALLLRRRPAQRAVEPALAAGALIVIGYGISGRLLPGLLHFARSVSAQGRLEQPLTYWNAMGELAALGFVLSARVAGDEERPRAMRAAAAAAAGPLGLGLYLSFSRGALFACVAGLVALVVAAPTREQLEAVLVSLLAGALSSVAAAPFKGLTSLAGSLATRERQGAIVLVLVVLIAGLAASAQWYLAGRRQGETLRLPRRAGWIALVMICAGLAVAIVVGSKETASRPLSAGASRYVTLQSNRYAYWRVAFKAFEQEPLRGVGAGGWAVWWLRYRPFDDFAQDAHSLPLQTLAELGLVGIVFLGAFFVGIGLAARRAYLLAPGLAAGPLAGFVTYAAHAPLDWDWQMPAVTLVGIVLAGELLALGERSVSPDKAQRARSSTAAGLGARRSLNRSTGRSTG
jgi:O-Antigen ligase